MNSANEWKGVTPCIDDCHLPLLQVASWLSTRVLTYTHTVHASNGASCTGYTSWPHRRTAPCTASLIVCENIFILFVNDAGGDVCYGFCSPHLNPTLPAWMAFMTCIGVRKIAQTFANRVYTRHRALKIFRAFFAGAATGAGAAGAPTSSFY